MVALLLTSAVLGALFLKRCHPLLLISGVIASYWLVSP